MTRSFGQTQKRTHGTIIPMRAKRTSGGMVKGGKHDDLHGEGLFSLAKSIFKRGKKAVDMAKKFAKSDLAKKAISAGKTAVKVGQTAADLYGSEAGQAVKQLILPSSDPSFPGEKHGLLNLPDGKIVTANYLGPGTQVSKRLKRGDVGRTPVDMLAMKHDIAYRKAQGAGSKAEQLRLIRKADEDMIAGIKKIGAMKADHPANIAQANLIIAKLASEKAGITPEGSFGGDLETIGMDEMNTLNAGQKQLEMMGYGKKSHPALKLKQKLAKQYGKGLKLAGQRGGMFNPMMFATLMGDPKMRKAMTKAVKDGKTAGLPIGVQMMLANPDMIASNKKGNGLKLAGSGQSGGFVFSLAALIGGISSAIAAAAPTVTTVAGAVGATAGAALAVKELAGGSLKSVIAKKIKEEAKLTKVKSTDLPKSIVKVADKKLQAIKKLDAPLKVKKELVVKQIAKPLIPLVKKKYVEKLGKRLKGSGLKLAGQRGKGLKLAGGAISDADIIKKIM